MALDQYIGVFDSGLGGLSVLQELRRELPAENYLYVGDSARNPYGPMGTEAVAQFTLEAAAFLFGGGAKVMVIACNTATVAALEAVRRAYPEKVIIGVVEPGSIAACEATLNGHIALVATRGTVESGVHAASMHKLRPEIRVTGIAAPILVALAEEGWLDGPVADAAAERYLSDLFSAPEGTRPDCLLLGCTHFPFLCGSIRKVVGARTTLVDPAVLTARQTRAMLSEKNLLCEGKHTGAVRYCVTADPERFARVGTLFLQEPVAQEDVKVVTLGCVDMLR